MKANRSQLSNIFGIARTTIDSYRAQGMPVESGGGRGNSMVFDTVKVFNWIMTRTPVNDDNYTVLLEQEKHRKLKRENDIEEKKVAPVQLLTDALVKAGNTIIPILESLPLIMKRNWPEITGDQITMVKKAIAECRNAIADSEIAF